MLDRTNQPTRLVRPESASARVSCENPSPSPARSGGTTDRQMDLAFPLAFPVAAWYQFAALRLGA